MPWLKFLRNKWTIALAVFVIAIVALSTIFWPKKESFVLATTTSVQDSGLLSAILPDFEREHGIEVHVIAVGTGEAIEYGKRGDAQALLVHSPALEKQFMDAGFGIKRKELFWNYFVLVGPISNPANISCNDSLAQAFGKIYSNGAKFVSRGDNSGTHQREISIWKELGIDMANLTGKTWYLNGSGSMANVLLVANEKGAYTLSDLATWAFLSPKLPNLKKIETRLTNESINIYSLIITKAGNESKGKALQEFWDWFTSEKTLARIENYTINGEQLFWRMEDVGECSW